MKLAQSLNRTVLVAIPAFFGDEESRACTLIDVESAGVWLACDDLRPRLEPTHEISEAWTEPVVAFFPFTQVLYIVDPSQFAALARGGQRPRPRGPGKPATPREGKRDRPHGEDGPKKKDPKGRR
jgi:hypothetical protein